ncbi:uncharacterized protein SETTUDRAFT_105426 [Exserohilum turcica Et28A]|uniref:Bacteriophage T5 Orf172 DNA-binding domain-containing protein n=1 Tax=Exserohilum turcicum (strain 28A) TaxID=671987 RepID=R0KMN4_EXST2|nr:uncharacterized protein SETTUDRAFT_105426 [Exserohilum turcica Et28A]EOA89192.1 hypothetical protein SETTUDRAFT_105426 [Exserohilum turcica Et28A]
MFTGTTPESLIARSDSRNPATTCKGITKSGRPCRRAIDAKEGEGEGEGVIAVTSVAGDGSDDEIGAAAYFCWQHKDQAETLAAKPSTGPATQLYPLKERNSIDTLVERLGVLDVEEQNEAAPRRRRSSHQGGRRRRNSGSQPPKRINRPPTWDTVEGPLMSVPSDVMAERKRKERPSKASPPKEKRGFWASLCCGSADDEYTETTREDSETAMLLRYIPTTVSPKLASTLLAELSKPISPHDEEGFIYIFWLTPEAAGPAPETAASRLLAPPSSARGDRGRRRTSDVMRQYSVKGDEGTKKAAQSQAAGKDTILLKIGRANNVHRRMNEWTRQCGYSLSLVRYYPHVSSTSTPSATPSPRASPANSRQPSQSGAEGVRKVPYAHRVERMIHVELEEQRVIKQCEACGKSHKEWFEVEATRDGVKKVDEVVKRWVEWAEWAEKRNE